jgi:hypothetical protein
MVHLWTERAGWLATLVLVPILAVSSTLYAVPRPGNHADADALVQQLRGLPAPMPVLMGGGLVAEGAPEPPPSPLRLGEQRRWQLYNKLHAFGADGVAALARGLEGPDVRLRRNVTLALGFLAEGSSHFDSAPSQIDIRAALPALITALRDRDEFVRASAAEDIGDIGPDAASAVPELIRLLSRDAGSRGSACDALRGIGPAAKSALPALKQLLSDPDDHVRKMASWAVAAIQGNPFSSD